jgi:hypothetical protein
LRLNLTPDLSPKAGVPGSELASMIREDLQMAPQHIAFVLEQAYGHVMPTLGIALELIRRGHRVSYATTADFVPVPGRI